jgi:hypothetical protein
MATVLDELRGHVRESHARIAISALLSAVSSPGQDVGGLSITSTYALASINREIEQRTFSSGKHFHLLKQSCP